MMKSAIKLLPFLLFALIPFQEGFGQEISMNDTSIDTCQYEIAYSFEEDVDFTQKTMSGSCQYGIERAIESAERGFYNLVHFGDYQTSVFQSYFETYLNRLYDISLSYAGCAKIEDEETACYNEKMREIIFSHYGPHFFENAKSEAFTNFENDIRFAPIYEIVNTMPEYVGGFDNMKLYLKGNLRRPRNSKGMVAVSCVVQKDGSLANIKIIKSLNRQCDREAMRVVANMPKWNPGYQSDSLPLFVRTLVPIWFDEGKYD